MSEKKSSIREQLAKLDELLAWFDSDDFEIDAALDVFEEAKKLADAIEQDLETVKNDITVIDEKFNRDKE